MDDEGNAALKTQVMAAVMAGDMAAMPALLHPDFEMRQAEATPYPGDYRGPQGFVDFLGRFAGMLEIERLEELDSFASPTGSIVGEVAIRARAKADGRMLDTTILEKWDFRDGKVLRISPHYYDPVPR